jgi:molybdenum cofactor guanylyltransferase
MSTTDKESHGKLSKPQFGEFGKKEFALYGTTCEKVEMLYKQLSKLLAHYDVAFADADHEPSTEKHTVYQEKNPGFCVTSTWNSNPYLRRNALAQADLVVVNGNHFKAQHQIIVCDENKENSLRKRSAELTNVAALITTTDPEKLPAYITELIPHHAQIPVFNIQVLQDVSSWIESTFLNPPKMNALIVAGGESTRMGYDKTMIMHHGVPQVKYLAQILEKINLNVYISCKESQREKFEILGLKTITDRVHSIGPIGGIISSFMSFPDHAHLVVAADIPLLDEEIIQTLIAHRDQTKIATSYQSKSDAMPEPLIAIWEPKSYPIILAFLAQGISCPRKVLLSCPINLIDHPLAEKLTNVNTLDELQKITERIRHLS